MKGRHPQPSTMTGFTIAEFMVAIAIGMFLITGLIGMYIAGKSSYNTNEVLSRTQENARFATDLLTRFLRLADYRTDNEDDHRQVQATITDSVRGCIAGTNCGVGFPGAADLPSELVGSSHAIHIKYTSPYDGLRDCTGATLGEGADVVATFAVGRANAGDPWTLYCNGQPLVQGVADLQIQYGIRAAGGNMRYTDHTDTGDQPTIAEWPSVIALRLILTVESGDETVTKVAKDEIANRADREYLATVQLRNRLL